MCSHMRGMVERGSHMSPQTRDRKHKWKPRKSESRVDVRFNDSKVLVVEKQGDAASPSDWSQRQNSRGGIFGATSVQVRLT